MVQYARTDAHYLLYIAHRLSSELKEQDTENSSSLREDKFSSVLEANRRSNAICLQLFSKETDAYPGESVASSIISRYQSDQGSSMSSSDEMKLHDLVRRLCTWRDIMIIRNYYGGREISDEDLERAMLIGMSPNERRRFEKQRKLACKGSNRSITPDGELDNKQAKGTSLPEEVSDNSSNSEENTNVLIVEDNNVSNHSSYPNFGVNSEYSVIHKNDFPHGRESLVKHDDVLPDSCDDESCNVSNGMANSVDNMNTNASSKNSKLSLLGHGPHGKQVVNHILNEHGDEGISQFCQRWRQVFVEAVHPRFLPAGWDIMHSGRRDFGEFSVYNPGKRTPTSTPEQ